MYELDKIKEAEYFYNQMLKAEEDINAFKYNLSAFLAAARSVLQFALKEAETKKGGKQWYDSAISKNMVISFFKDKRDVNIHTEPVKVRKDINILIKETLRVSESIRIIKRDANGNIIEESQSESEPPKIQKEIPPEAIYKFKFNDWSGSEDIPTLCQKYLTELKNIVSNGQAKRFLS